MIGSKALPAFDGAKIALFRGESLLVMLRDDRPDLSWPGAWDLPGGGREGNETPVACALRELEEEFGLRLPPGRLFWHRIYPRPGLLPAHFFAGTLSSAEVTAIRFGNEGQEWRLMPVAEFVAHPKAVPVLRSRVADCLAAGFRPEAATSGQ
ncbi:DNA mismatch repair protein MutT [Haematobacter massiliensis]|uniref:DNA mismatch repair protein MutT n=1 Tax=Haematobacter massiliensis TaxID=195105 RepID=A0A086XX44_9RHOB|nr:NUDIX hydrolase [Haematobacter massiliensis]KFI26594.1 DNA mismatch repair protein MutT [Haematobacter massiliensis]